MSKLLSYLTLAYRPEIKCEKQYYDNKVHYVAGVECATKYVDKHSCNLQSQEARSIISSKFYRCSNACAIGRGDTFQNKWKNAVFGCP